MKVTAEIDVTPAQYFKHLCSGVVKDIKKATNQIVFESQLIDGYEYVHSVKYKNKDISVKFTIGPLIPDKYFQVKYETGETACQYYYDFSESDGKYYVTYSEDTGYKQETVGNYLGNLKKKFTQAALKNKILTNIESTVTYIKNNEM